MPGIIKPKTPAPDETPPPDALPPFPLSALPPLLRNMAAGIHETTGVPLDICAPCVIATACACLGRGLLVDSAPGRVSAPNLYTLVVKPSGAGGSVAYTLATAPLRGFQSLAMREFDEVTKPQQERKRDTIKADYEDAVKTRRKQRAEGEDTAAIETQMDGFRVELAGVEAALCPPSILVSDTTPESLAHMLSRRGEVMAHFDSDANDTVGTILGIRYGDGKHTTESLHLKAWSGESYAISRKGTAKSGTLELFLKHPTLACLFIVTPDVARKLFASDRMMTGGLLPRFLVVNSQAKPLPWNDDAPRLASEVSQPYEAACFAMLNNYRDRKADELPALEMTGEATGLFKSRHQRFCDGYTPESSAFQARHTENAIRLALVLHAWGHVSFEHAADGRKTAHCTADAYPLNGDSARAGLEVAAWFEAHLAAMLAPMREAAQDEKLQKLIALCDRRREWIVTARDLVGARLASNAEEADKLLTAWEQEGRAVQVKADDKPGVGAKTRKPRYQIGKR